MKFFSLFIDEPVVLCVLLEKKGNHYIVLEKKQFNQDHDLVSIRHYIQYIKHTLKETVFVTGLDIKEVSLKHGKIPKSRGKELQELLNFELEKHNVFTKEQSVSAFSFVSISPKDLMQEVSFSTCSKKSLEAHFLKLQDFNLAPHVVTTVSQAIFRYSQINIPLEELLVVDQTQSCLRMVYICNKKIEKACEISFAKYPKDSLAYWQEADKFFFRCFQGCGNKNLNIVFYKEQMPGQKLADLLHEYGVIPSIYPIDQGFEQMELPYYLPIGMCLDALAEDKLSINLADDNMGIWQNYKQTLAKFAFSMLCIAVTLGFISSSVFSLKQRQIEKQICRLLQQVYGTDKYKSLALFEKNLGEKIKLLDKQVRLIKKNALAPPTFSVNKILQDFENIIKKEKVEGRISNISYEMVSYPTAENKKAPYEAKVMFIFQTFSSIQQVQLPSYWHQFSKEKKGDYYEISFVVKDSY
jgi:hypothetical protein